VILIFHYKITKIKEPRKCEDSFPDLNNIKEYEKIGQS
jgi:hypothetical protein